MKLQSLTIGIAVILLVMSQEPVSAQQDRWVEETVCRWPFNFLHHQPDTITSFSFNQYDRHLPRTRFPRFNGPMDRLIMMLGTEEGGISAETARWLLYVIGSVTPSQYLDQSAQSHLRLINEFYVVDEVSEVLREAGGKYLRPSGGRSVCVGVCTSHIVLGVSAPMEWTCLSGAHAGTGCRTAHCRKRRCVAVSCRSGQTRQR